MLDLLKSSDRDQASGESKGKAFDEKVARIGRPGDIVANRLAALHLRNNVRSRRKVDAKQLADLDILEANPHWHTPGRLSDVRLDAVPDSEGVFSLREPHRNLFLSQSENMRSDIGFFQDANILASVGNHFWSPSPGNITVDFVRQSRCTIQFSPCCRRPHSHPRGRSRCQA